MSEPLVKPQDPVTTRGGETGRATGSTHRCRMHGCNGRRITVRWPDRKITHPCTKGMERAPDGGWRVL